jgi:hypothetical protein
MEEAPEKGKEWLHSAHANGMNEMKECYGRINMTTAMSPSVQNY